MDTSEEDWRIMRKMYIYNQGLEALLSHVKVQLRKTLEKRVTGLCHSAILISTNRTSVSMKVS